MQKHKKTDGGNVVILKPLQVIPFLDDHFLHSVEIENLKAKCLSLFRLSYYKSQDHPIIKILNRIEKYHKQGRFFERNTEENRLEMLIKQMNDIKKYDLSLFNSFRNEFNKRSADPGCWGIRFEIRVCSELIKSGIAFKKGESPDFKIFDHQTHAWIECTSLRFISSKKPIVLDERVVSKYISKSHQPYCNLKTALFMDITNIMQKISQKEQQDISFHINHTRQAIQSSFSVDNYGALFLCFSIYNPQENIFQTGHVSFFSPHVDENLSFLLNKTHPYKPQQVSAYFIPVEG